MDTNSEELDRQLCRLLETSDLATAFDLAEECLSFWTLAEQPLPKRTSKRKRLDWGQSRGVIVHSR